MGEKQRSRSCFMPMLYFGRDMVGRGCGELCGQKADRQMDDRRIRISKICSVVSTVRKKGCRETRGRAAVQMGNWQPR